jgi:Flp pilus assembly protein TadG
MLRHLAALRRSTAGTAIWEFAIVFPLLMVIGMGIWEVGRIADALLVATNAAREGARYAAAHTTDANLTSETQSFVWSYLQSGYGNRLSNGGGNGGDVTVTSNQVQVQFFDTSGNASPTAAPGYQVKVTVPVQAKVFTVLVPGLSNPTTVTGVASMKLQ